MKYILIELPSNVTVGNYVSIAHGTYFHNQENHPCINNKKLVSTYAFGNVWGADYPSVCGKGKTIVGNDVWIGREAKILDGVTIGDGAIIGAYSIVTKDIPPFAIVAGNPARIKKFRFTKKQIESLQKIKWWTWDKKTVLERMEDFKDINKFIKKYR